MMKRIYFIALLGLAALCAHAETIVLRTGARVRGEIVFQNEEVVIVRDLEGARFQYPRTDVLEILSDKNAEEQTEQANTDEEAIQVSKKASILIELSGGGAFQPNEAAGGGFGVDLLVGSHHIQNRHLFIGAGLGYHGMFIGSEKYNFLPIQAALRMPLIEQKHAPVFGVAVGYGIALSKNYLGGVFAGIDFGYRCQINEKTAIALLAYAQFQQAKIHVTETIDGSEFTNSVGRNLVASGLKFALYF